MVLAYIPASKDQITLVPNSATDTRTADQIWSELNTYLSNDSYLKTRRGKYTERNAARTPWNNELNLRLMQDIRFKAGQAATHTLQISLDILNLANLLNKSWGQSYFVPNTNNSTTAFGLTQKGLDSNGNPTFTYITPTTKPYSVDMLASRWQGQLGIRYTF